jgi:hypothetical protein
MNVLFINDSSSNPNWGDRAAAIALRLMIEAVNGKVDKTISEEELCGDCFSNPVQKQEAHKETKLGWWMRFCVPPVAIKVGGKLYSLLCSSGDTGSKDIVPETWEEFPGALEHVKAHRDRFSELLAAMEKSEALLIHGGGCFVGNARIARAELFLAYLAKHLFGKPVVLVNHTADLDHSNLRKIAQEMYPLLDDVVFRDTISYERCKGFCNGRVAADSAFLFKPIKSHAWVTVSSRPTYFDVWPDVAMFDPGKPYICIGGSSVYYYKKTYNAPEGFIHLIRHLRSIYEGQIVLTASDLRDEALFRPIAKEFGFPLIGLNTPVQQSVDILGNAQAYVGGRWHPSIFALRGGTPIITLSSLTFKMQALGQMAGLTHATFNSLDLNAETGAIGSLLLTYLEQGEQLRSNLMEWAESESRKSWDNVAYLHRMQRAQCG